jgi:hypothetical protein
MPAPQYATKIHTYPNSNKELEIMVSHKAKGFYRITVTEQFREKGFVTIPLVMDNIHHLPPVQRGSLFSKKNLEAILNETPFTPEMIELYSHTL